MRIMTAVLESRRILSYFGKRALNLQGTQHVVDLQKLFDIINVVYMYMGICCRILTFLVYSRS